jgi:hypothetical protein
MDGSRLAQKFLFFSRALLKALLTLLLFAATQLLRLIQLLRPHLLNMLRLAGSGAKPLWHAYRVHLAQQRRSIILYLALLAVLITTTTLVALLRAPHYQLDTDSTDRLPLRGGKLPVATAPLLREKASLTALLTIAAQDSPALYINLPDSCIDIMIKGVCVKRCPLVRFSQSAPLKALRGTTAVLPWLEHPFAIKSAQSTIERIPVRVKKAPRDTLEANKAADDVPEPLPLENVRINLTTNRLLRIQIVQDEPYGAFGTMNRILSAPVRGLAQSFWVFGHTLLLKPAPHYLNLTLVLSRQDATICFRSLPEKGPLALRL